MSIKIIKQFAGKKSESAKNASVVDRLRARRAARKAAEALVLSKKGKKSEEEGEPEQVDDINMDADTASVIYSDQESNIQVIVGEDPVEGGIVVAVATAENDNLEEEEVLASVTVGEGEEPAPAPASEEPESQSAAEEAKKKSVEEARAAIKARLQR